MRNLIADQVTAQIDAGSTFGQLVMQDSGATAICILTFSSTAFGDAAAGVATAESITDVGCSLRAYRAEYLRHLPVFDGMHRFLPTFLKLNGARILEIEVNHRPRRFGTSKYGVHNRLWRGIADLFGVRWLQKRWIDRSVAHEVYGHEVSPSSESSPGDTLPAPASRTGDSGEA